MRDPAESSPWVLRIGHEVLVIRKRYEFVSIVNDFLIAIWFSAGSLLFFHEDTANAGTRLFLLGSCELAVRPVIRHARHVRLRRLRLIGRQGSDQDF
ncbi:YrhK family protein [Saccharopolyspora spinosa]|uniref:YrhK-like protein n=1 Tax=Saccharopolyspora spinosa TaxID=60894 RepID=A0A2N3XTW6_SACSN|nr:YrhK family protein [Saccharopolyspora spinosa]PKW14079.1 YrhK-like protein [Saccharopolyspora spinosa]